MARRPSQRSISRGSANRQYGALPGTPKAPVATAAPTIAGTPTVGQTLTATGGTWANTPTTLVGQWFRGHSAISGATGTTYTLTGADAGWRISYGERRGNAVGYATARSAQTTEVAAA